jgi:hypothetical protein
MKASELIRRSIVMHESMLSKSIDRARKMHQDYAREVARPNSTTALRGRSIALEMAETLGVVLDRMAAANFLFNKEIDDFVAWVMEDCSRAVLVTQQAARLNCFPSSSIEFDGSWTDLTTEN